MEKNICFTSDGYEIEGRLEKNHGKKGVVVTHPHPLYGGNMYNDVVESILRAYLEKNYTTLRFNFRGVEGSQGTHDNGIGEQNDVLNAIEYLENLGISHIDLAGYSFGAWINATASSSGANINNLVLVSPPVGFIDFTSITAIPRLKLVISGSRDDIAPAEVIQDLISEWNTKALFEVIPEADHFYTGYLDKLSSILDQNLA